MYQYTRMCDGNIRLVGRNVPLIFCRSLVVEFSGAAPVSLHDQQSVVKQVSGLIHPPPPLSLSLRLKVSEMR